MTNDYRDAVLADSPVAYWRMGEASGSVVDSAGSNTGTASGTVTRNVAGALATDGNGAITFGGGVVTVADHATLDLGDVVTVEAWVSSAVGAGIGGGGNKGIVGKDTGAYYLDLTSANTLRFLKANITDMVHSTTIVPGTGWHHVVATKNGSTVKLYIDAVDVTGTVTNATLVNNSHPVYIGAADSVNDRMVGSIDEVALYGTALSAARVLAHYNAARTFYGTGAGTQAAATANGTGTVVDLAAPSHGHGAPLGAARVIGPAGDRTPRKVRIKGKGGGEQAAASAYGTGFVNDDDLVLLALDAA